MAKISKIVLPNGNTYDISPSYPPAGNSGDVLTLTVGSGGTREYSWLPASTDIPVSDVQIAGTSIVADSVANIGVSGGLKTVDISGVTTIRTNPATETNVKGRTEMNRPITPDKLEVGVKACLSDSKVEWTEEEQRAARLLLGLPTIRSGTVLPDDAEEGDFFFLEVT